MSSPESSPRPLSNPRWLFGVLGVLILAALVAAGWFLFRSGKPETKEDLVAASHANARGVGHMDQFEFARAVEAFEETIALAPSWLPGRINLGIALLNAAGVDPDHAPALFDRSIKTLQDVLAKEPDNPYSHFGLGIIYLNRGNTAEAAPHFEAVTRVDSRDAHAWYFLGLSQPNPDESEAAYSYLEKAVKLDPYLNAAIYALAQHRITAEKPDLKERLLNNFERLRNTDTADLAGVKYTEMGRYGEVIGKSPAAAPALGVMPLFEPVADLKVVLAPGTSWASPDKLSVLQKAVRARFGGSVIQLDYNRDGRPDLLLTSAVLRDGEVRDLLLRNDGGNVFTDVSAEAGLANLPGSFGGAAGDYDNDGFPDLALAGPAGVKLLRNNGGKVFEDQTAAAGFDKERGVFLTVAWVDLDQDGDLDLVAAKYAETLELAFRQISGEAVDGKGGLRVFINVGVAPPVPKGQPSKPLSTAFKSATEPEALLVKGPVTGIVVADIDGLKDMDLVVLVDGQPPVSVLNDRLLRFHQGQSLFADTGRWNGGLVLAANSDDQPDLVLLDSASPPKILVSAFEGPAESLPARFVAGSSNSPPLRSAAWVDLDLDGRTDLIGLSSDRKPVFLQGDGAGKFSRKSVPFGPKAESLQDLLAVVPMHLEDVKTPAILLWSESSGLHLFRSNGNGNNGLRLALTGMRDPGKSHQLRTNADGIGCSARLMAGPLSTAAFNTTLTAGLGQSRTPIGFGIGRANAVDAVQLRWPDAIPQAELNQPSGLVTIVETSRKVDSCPTIYVWDGERYVFITDCLGAGSMGELESDGTTRKPRPQESVKLEPGTFVPKNGKFTLKIGEPMDEVMYLDRLRLDVIDHPAGVSVFPDERFATADPEPTQERLFFRDAERIFPAKAIDQRGRDVTAVLRERDGAMVDDFAFRSWLGFAEDHWVELDFNGRLKSLPSGRKAYLVLAGWTDYPYPESIFAATQAGVPPIWPVLEQKQTNGAWKSLGEIGLPAGLPRVMTVDVTGWIDPQGGPVRIRTNLQIFWDQVFIAPVAESVEASVKELPVARATLERRGFTQEITPGGKPPISYDYDRLEQVACTKWRGRLTRTGDVTELLNAQDDHFVICGPGDEISADFDAASLPPLKAGWQRSFVLRTWGYCKDTALATATCSQIGPLPFQAMSRYPYDPRQEPLPQHIVEYDRIWNTRSAGGR
jgi:tetratricopeptide (TPR) repeat protein